MDELSAVLRNPNLAAAFNKLRPSMSPEMFRRAFTSEECEALREYIEQIRTLLREWAAACPSPPEWHWSFGISAKTVRVLSGESSIPSAPTESR